MKILAISDLHGLFPKVPECDLLLIAGDLCPDRLRGQTMWAQHYPDQQGQWLRTIFDPWVSGRTTATQNIVAVAGNHDWYLQIGTDASAYTVQCPYRMLQDAMTLSQDLVIWGTPWSNKFCDWAFMKKPEELESVYRKIPKDVDIIVSHQPPYGYGDYAPMPNTDGDRHVGSKELLKTIERVRPRAVVCGHIHGGYGRYQHKGIPIYNVSVVNERYELVNPATEITLR